jgi:cephalosporin hydroxylase
VDINHDTVPDIVKNHPRIKLITGDACEKLNAVKDIIPEEAKVIVIEDSAHTIGNTLNVLRKYSPLVSFGSYFIVEDGIINHGLDTEMPAGPYEAIENFILENNNFEIDRTKESFLITWNPKGYLKKIK